MLACEICPPGHEKQPAATCESNDITLDDRGPTKTSLIFLSTLIL